MEEPSPTLPQNQRKSKYSPRRKRYASSVSSETLAQTSLLAFAMATYRNYKTSEHLAKLAAYLNALDDGKINRLLVTMPPRHGKSELCSVRFPAWLLGRNPSHRYVIASYGADLATRFSREVRAIIASPTFETIFPDTKLSDDSRAVDAWDVADHRGGLRAVGVGGALTGHGAHGIIIDDPVKSRAEAESRTYRDSIWHWYRSVAYTRLEPNGWILLVMTRWHEDDLAGRLLAQARHEPTADQWIHLHLPAISDDNQPLWPERYPIAELERIKTTIGPREWEALYQGRPRSPEGALFRRDWFQIIPNQPPNLRWCRYWDLAASTKTSADYTASVAAALDTDGKLYIRDIIRGRWEWPDVRRRIIETAQQEPTTSIGVESTGFQMAAMQDIMRDQRMLLKDARPINVDKDKVTRALPWAARAEMGKVFIVAGPHVEEFIEECAEFPLGAHDDQVDAVSGAVQMLHGQMTAEYGPPIW